MGKQSSLLKQIDYSSYLKQNKSKVSLKYTKLYNVLLFVEAISFEEGYMRGISFGTPSTWNKQKVQFVILPKPCTAWHSR